MIARTSRLLLRPGWQDDAVALSAALNDEGLARNMRIPFPYAPEHAEQFLAIPYDPLNPRLLIFSRTQATPRLVGGCGLVDGELGYWISRRYWGLGFATEAAQALVGAGRAMGYERIRACHAVDNPASGRVLRKLGFRPTGEFTRIFSPARGQDVLSVMFEDCAEADMCVDLAEEVYRDSAVMAA